MVIPFCNLNCTPSHLWFLQVFHRQDLKAESRRALVECERAFRDNVGMLRSVGLGKPTGELDSFDQNMGFKQGKLPKKLWICPKQIGFDQQQQQQQNMCQIECQNMCQIEYQVECQYIYIYVR